MPRIYGTILILQQILIEYILIMLRRRLKFNGLTIKFYKIKYDKLRLFIRFFTIQYFSTVYEMEKRDNFDMFLRKEAYQHF